MSGHGPDFDGIARHYRLLEYLSMGRALESARFHFIDSLTDARRALVLGDGDGRFVERLLYANSQVNVVAVDSSMEMLRLLKHRCAKFAPRLQTFHQDALAFANKNQDRVDLVATHFFLDCLGQKDVDQLIARIASQLEPGGVWVISEFRVPAGGLRLPAWVMVRGLYFAFRALTGLGTTRLPDYEFALSASGLKRVQRELSMGGVLTAELWRKA